ncbi:pheromone-binding protein-like [Anticarsia gemmatalis]|uniref:pheromone-binding protein-like n=1 Tax=Anticarsia gemmatalis TaxID=129554 RepID=UPI003F767C77
MKLKILWFSAFVLIILGDTEIDVMRSISKHIGNVVLDCNKEMKVEPKVIGEFLRYWDPKHELTIREQGCVLACVLKKLELLQPGGALRSDNMNAFCSANGADETMTTKIKDLYQLCSSAALTKNSTDGCALGLEISKCFRYGIFHLNWAPDNADYEVLPEVDNDSPEEMYYT